MEFWPIEFQVRAERLVADLTAQGHTVATAESCTGGLIVSLLTEIPGASVVVECGFVVYSNNSKMRLIGVKPQTLETWGAVSFQTAEEMEQGALACSQATFAIAVTGIAGPGGGSLEKPVGLAHIVAISHIGHLIHREVNYSFCNRSEIRLAIVAEAIDILVLISQAIRDP